MIITATVDAALYAVKLTATGATGTVEWFRRYAGANTPIGTGTTLWDYTADLNRPYEYVATDDVSSEVAGPVTIAADGPVLASTTSPLAKRVTVVDYRPLTMEGRSVWHPVLGRRDPFVTIHPTLYPSGTLRLWAATNTDRVAITELMDGGEPLLLRSTCPDRVDTMTFIVLRGSDPFAGEGRKHGPAYLELEFQMVSEVAGVAPPAPDRTYQTVVDDHPTYTDVLDGYATYRGLLDGAA